MKCKGFVWYRPGIGAFGPAVRRLGADLLEFDEVDVEKLTLDMQSCSEIEEIDVCVRG